MHDQRAEAKRQIQDRIDFYKTVQLAKTEDKYLEARVKSAFIAPFLNALGWKPDSNEVYPEYPVGRDKVDYALQAGGVGEEPKIFVEAKKFVLPEGLDSKERDPYTGEDITFPEKAIQYAWRKNVEWVILTNFKELRIYNIKRSKIPRKAEWLRTTYDKYLDKETFETIWAFSREGAASGLLDAFEIRGKRKPVDRQFLEDLVKCRLLLIGNIRRLNKELKPELLKECVQRILDRLVIMRAAEDLGVEKMDRLRMEILKPKEGWDKLNQWLFKNFNERFNSKIFDTHPCDNLKIDDEIIQKVVDILYNGTGESSGYRFDQIRADVLGSMYEDYIGYILKEEGDVFELEREMGKRKAEGIYYTPTYVVEFIVENTLGTLLKDMSPSEVKNIHILDPACGSGSFLTKAQDVLRRYYESTMKQLKKKEGGRIDLYISEDYTSLSKDILTKNIYGVDLDSQAAEIASVNLSLKVLADMKKEMKLPEVMGQNIKVGNSIISGSDNELRKYFENPKEKKPFSWEYRFKEVFKDGGFDVVIGNPPYFSMETRTDEEQNYFKNVRPDVYRGKNDVYYYFIALGLDLLKNGGYLGFIVERYWLEATYADKLREFTVENAIIKNILDFGKVQIFPEAGNHTCVLILKKEKNPEKRKNNLIKVVRVKNWIESNEKLMEHILRHVNDEEYLDEFIQVFNLKQGKLGSEQWILTSQTGYDLIKKLGQNSWRLIDLCEIEQGQKSGLNKAFAVNEKDIQKYNLERGLLKKLIKNSDINRYSINWKDKYLIYTSETTIIEDYPNIKKYLEKFKKALGERAEVKDNLYPWYRLQRPRRQLLFDAPEKLVVPYRAPKNKFGYDNQQFFNDGGDIRVIVPKEDCPTNIKFIAACLNSKLLDYYFKFIGRPKGDVFEYFVEPLSKIPIHKIDLSNLKDRGLHHKITQLVDEILRLTRGYNETLQIFQKILDNLKDSKTKLKPFGKYYFKEGSAYGIDLAKTKKLIDTNLGGKVTAIEVEDEGESLVLNAKYGDEEDFVSVIRIHIKDNTLRKFFYYTMKIYLMEKVKTRMWGEGKIIDVVLNALEIPRFETNIEMDKGRIRKLMSEFFKSSPIKDKSLSEVGKEIQRTDSLIDQKVYGLYGITESEKKIIEESLQ